MNNNQAKKTENTIKQRKNQRYKDFNYSSDGYYYVTICTDKKRDLFGILQNNQVVLNPLGKLVEENIRALNDLKGVSVTAHIVMPNHLHLLLEIGNRENNTDWTLSKLIIRIKSKVMVEYSRIDICEHKKEKIWQRNYWDYIVRKQEELTKIAEYISRNPEFWEREKENPENEYHTLES